MDSGCSEPRAGSRQGQRHVRRLRCKPGPLFRRAQLRPPLLHRPFDRLPRAVDHLAHNGPLFRGQGTPSPAAARSARPSCPAPARQRPPTPRWISHPQSPPALPPAILSSFSSIAPAPFRLSCHFVVSSGKRAFPARFPSCPWPSLRGDSAATPPESKSAPP